MLPDRMPLYQRYALLPAGEAFSRMREAPPDAL